MSAGPYSIGSRTIPGLSKLVEECGEVTQVVGKIIGVGGLGQHWDGQDLKARLEEEIADVMAACVFVIVHNNLDPKKINARSDEKLQIFDKWHADGLK